MNADHLDVLAPPELSTLDPLDRFPAGRERPAIPLVFDSPHSGWCMPRQKPAASTAVLATSCDAFVDELFGRAREVGAGLLAARFPRWLVDANRARDDLDPSMIVGEPLHPLRPSAKSGHGMGVLRQLALPGIPVYAAPLAAADAEALLCAFWDPYHAALRSMLDDLHARHGAVWHINCHSMKSVGNEMNDDLGAERPDFVISDRRGKTSAPEFVEFVADALREPGYAVQVNDPYVGAELIAAYSNPDAQRHSIQIEINRRLYMDEASLRKHEGFERLRRDLSTFVDRVAGYVRANAGLPG
ncbi:MAG TPA: N-formylglutamate amidohydrolase [Burkholderiales bacterium]|nr:N-formylglutamate amidohydrolase [Burkholderiales bacterium]